jgi:hypothetical protein
MTTRVVSILFMWANILWLLVHPEFPGVGALMMVPWACIYLGDCIMDRSGKFEVSIKEKEKDTF